MTAEEATFKNAPKKNPAAKEKAEKEKDIEADLCDMIKSFGGTAYKFTSPARPSVPDRLCVLPKGLMFFAELKAPGKKPTEAQQREISKLQTLGVTVFVVSDFVGVATLRKFITGWYKSKGYNVPCP